MSASLIGMLPPASKVRFRRKHPCSLTYTGSRSRARQRGGRAAQGAAGDLPACHRTTRASSGATFLECATDPSDTDAWLRRQVGIARPASVTLPSRRPATLPSAHDVLDLVFAAGTPVRGGGAHAHTQ